LRPDTGALTPVTERCDASRLAVAVPIALFATMKLTPRRLRFLLNVYPPYWATGIRVTDVAPDWREAHVELKLRWYNRNAVGTHFGGNLYSMADPWLMLLLIQLLGPDYVVWDRSASIDFKRPGTSLVRATIRIDDEALAAMRRETEHGAAYRHEFDISILGEQDELVAVVHKTLHVRRR
jgi:acyl-coenzyme A thioesterase PaaI-like protein